MIVETPQIRLPLLPGQVVRLDLLAGSRLRSTAGTAWITMDGDPRDIVLGCDEEMLLDADCRVLACALRADGRAELRVCDPVVAELCA
jgi:hypothetical protein